MKRPQPARALGACRRGSSLRPHPRIDRHSGPADQLSSLPPRPLALDAQRGHCRFPVVEARPHPGRRAWAVPADRGSTDSELFFFLAPTFGLEADPPEAVARAVGFIEETGRRNGVQYPIQLTVATTDGESTWAFRYSSEGRSRSLFHSADVSTLRLQYPDNPVLHELSDDARIVVSEPLGDLRGAWREVPESTCVVVQGGREVLREFSPSRASALK